MLQSRDPRLIDDSAAVFPGLPALRRRNRRSFRRCTADRDYCRNSRLPSRRRRGHCPALFRSRRLCSSRNFPASSNRRIPGIQRHNIKALFDGVKGLVGQHVFLVRAGPFQTSSESLKAAVVRIENRPVHKIKKPLAEFLFRRAESATCLPFSSYR